MANKPTLLIASSNAGKIREFARALDIEQLRVVTPLDLDISLEVDEVGTSYDENALLKAQAYAEASHLPALGDDSGLEVEALNNEPGLFSARWVAGTDHDRNIALLEQLDGEANRAATFYTSLCLYLPNKTKSADNPLYFRGKVSGQIITKSNLPDKAQGFGYDPLFVPDGHELTFGQMDGSLKDAISHRGNALAKLKNFLKNHLELLMSI